MWVGRTALGREGFGGSGRLQVGSRGDGGVACLEGFWGMVIGCGGFGVDVVGGLGIGKS